MSIRGPVGHRAFQGLFPQPLVGDDRVGRHEAAPRQRLALDCHDVAVRADAFQVVRPEHPGPLDPLGDHGRDVALAVLAALGVVPHELGEMRAGDGQAVRQVEQIEQPPVRGDEAKLAVEDRETLVYVIEGGLQKLELHPRG